MENNKLFIPEITTTAITPIMTVEIPLSLLSTNPERFQGRHEEYAEESVNRIIRQGYDPNKMDSIIVYYDSSTTNGNLPNGATIWVGSGHSRLEAHKRLGLATIKARFFFGTIEAFAEYAKDSNNLGTPQLYTTRIERWRKFVDGSTAKQLSPLKLSELIADSETEAAANLYTPLCFLHKEGMAWKLLCSVVQSNLKGIDAPVEEIAQTVGTVMMKLYGLGMSCFQENEITTFLLKKSNYKKYKSPAALYSLVFKGCMQGVRNIPIGANLNLEFYAQKDSKAALMQIDDKPTKKAANALLAEIGEACKMASQATAYVVQAKIEECNEKIHSLISLWQEYHTATNEAQQVEFISEGEEDMFDLFGLFSDEQAEQGALPSTQANALLVKDNTITEDDNAPLLISQEFNDSFSNLREGDKFILQSSPKVQYTVLNYYPNLINPQGNVVQVESWQVVGNKLTIKGEMKSTKEYTLKGTQYSNNTIAVQVIHYELELESEKRAEKNFYL